MKNSPLDPERIAADTARRLLERATALDTDGPTLDQLRQAAEEAGISPAGVSAALGSFTNRPIQIATRPNEQRG
jgi:negative regulator of sigma E activity